MSLLALVAILAGAIVLAGLALAFLMWPSARRTRAIRGFAAKHALSYMGSTWVLGDCDFALFQRGRDRRWSNVLSGQWNGTTLVYADYEFTEDGQNSNDQDNDQKNPNPQNANQTYAFSAVVADLGCRMPQVDVMARSMAGGLAEELGVQGVEFDNEAFNDRYVVESEDERFAQELIDDRMIDALLQCPPDLHVQLGPQRMIVWGQRRPPLAVSLMLDSAAALDRRVPVIVRQEHSLAGSAAPQA